MPTKLEAMRLSTVVLCEWRITASPGRHFLAVLEDWLLFSRSGASLAHAVFVTWPTQDAVK